MFGTAPAGLLGQTVLLLFFFNREHFMTTIRTTMRANLVGRFVFAAFLAHNQVEGSQMVVRTSFIPTRF